MKILIIGGCGYIGSALHKFLIHTYDCDVDTVDLEWFGNYNNPNNYKIDYDLLSQSYLNRFDVVILVAANSSVQMCSDINSAIDNNLIKFINLVRKLKNQKFIYASSSCVYTSNDVYEKTEEDILNPIDGLTYTKTSIDNYMKFTDIEYYGLRFGSVNGWSPNTRLDLMINAMTFSAMSKNIVYIFNGNAHRPILSITDLCGAVSEIIYSNKDNRGIYNIASFNDNIYNIGKSVSEQLHSELEDLGNTFTYDFKISSKKFIDTYNFKFSSTVNSIVLSLVHNNFNPNWEKREKIYDKI